MAEDAKDAKEHKESKTAAPKSETAEVVPGDLSSRADPKRAARYGQTKPMREVLEDSGEGFKYKTRGK